jgi:NTE family protein
VSEDLHQDHEPESGDRDVKIAYAVFEGGGAKGITHIGALEALRRDYAIVGAAGASAGAIIAALVAVGYTAEELFDEANRTDILSSRYGKVPIQLLGEGEWEHAAWLLRLAPFGLAFFVYTVAAVLLLWGTDPPLWAAVPILLWMAASLIPAAKLAWPVISSGGLFRTQVFRDQVERLIRDRIETIRADGGVAPEDLGEFVRFKDISPAVMEESCILKIVVTDTRTRRMLQFDDATTPDASVADAVVASAALPGVFRPPPIRGWDPGGDHVYVDGGLVSNLPVWAFTTEKKELDRIFDYAIPVFAFTLNAPARPLPIEAAATAGGGPERIGRPAAIWGKAGAALRWAYFLPFNLLALALRPWGRGFSFVAHFREVVETGIFGSQTVVHGLVPDLRIVEMASPLTTTEFGCSRDDAIRAYVEGRESASAKLAFVRDTAEAESRLLTEFLANAARRIAGLRKGQGRSPNPHLRAHIVDRVPGGSFRVAISVGGDESDADDRIELGRDNPAAALAFETGELTVVLCDGSPGSIQEKMSKYERAQLRRDRRSIASIPVFRADEEEHLPQELSEREIIRVIWLDSDDDLRPDVDDERLGDWLIRETMVFQPQKEKPRA